MAALDEDCVVGESLDGAIDLIADCNSIGKEGGLKKTAYFGAVEDVVGITISATTGELTGIALRAGARLIKAVGRKDKNSSTYGVEQTDNGANFPHNFTFVAYYSTQLQKDLFIEKLARREDVFAIVPRNYGKFEAYGLVGKNGSLADGLKMTATGGSGILKTDDTSLPLVFAGSASKLPIYTAFAASEALEIAYLDDLTEIVPDAPVTP